MAVGAGGDEHVSGDDRETARQRPDVQVVHAHHVRLAESRLPDRLRLDVSRGDLEKDSRRFPKQSRSAPEHEPGDDQTGDRVEAIPPGRKDQSAGDRSARERGEVGENVEERAADVQALATGASEQRRRGDVDDDARKRDDEDDPAVHVLG